MSKVEIIELTMRMMAHIAVIAACTKFISGG